jgi:hypothetical protein
MEDKTKQGVIMNASELKYQVEQSGNCEHFFTRKTMSFFGDTMKNYGVRSAVIVSNYDTDDNYVADGQPVECWELYRKQAVKHGLKTSAYFDKVTFSRIHPKN